ncbi:hypothetical protein ACMU_06010 [Actibacterium mucosum KCTC 23349]|uniref:Uncharacterized protein n=1 Tax=Actibacterium mucosum KCTC 23349 TaxID=1454373 RepID=A0A037ZJ95_9RHOB|nr:hypothetical protein [Actibacterium mucosum]KAJ56495.1 hypothetical protein ACMU_06010 [Actibacterium mucosum KCTC 23349]
MTNRATFAKEKRNGWYFLYEPDAFTLARRPNLRFHVAADTVLPRVNKVRLATQIRQDLWRALRRVRGFCPMVRVEEDGTHLRVRAGGEVSARTYPKSSIEQTIADLLANPEYRARWITHAKRRPAHDQ